MMLRRTQPISEEAPTGVGTKSIDVSIIIVSFNTQALLEECLASLADGAAGVQTEIIVVDNGSSDASVEAVRKRFSTVRLVANEHNLGFVRANNQGIAQARGRYVWLLNSDTVASGASLDKLVRFADSHPQTGIIGARLVFPDGAPQNSWADFPTLRSELTGRNLQRHAESIEAPGWHARSVDWVNGAAMFCRKAMLDAIGGLDEEIFMYSEETDLCYRARENNWLVVHLADAVVTHWGGASARSNSVRRLQLLYGGKLYFFRKHRGRIGEVMLRGALIGATLWGIARRGVRMLQSHNDRSDAAAALHARWHLLGWLLKGGQATAAGTRPRKP